jgi:uncharacterized protein DUF4350
VSTATGGARGRLRSAAPFVLLGIALVLAVVLTGGPPDRGLPLDPRSAGPLGTKALVDVLRELGVAVEIGDRVPDRAGGAVLLLSDQIDEAGRDELRAWVADGGRLVVADPSSPLAPDVSGSAALGFTTPSVAPGDCELAALAGVGRVTVPGAAVYETPEAAVGCYPRNEGAWLVARSEGAGTIVSLGGPSTFTNLELGRGDNAALAGALLIPEGTVTVLEPPPPGAGDATLLDLIAPRVRLAIVQLLIAFAVVVGWRARRLGRPLVEPSPVEVPGSELVVAVGNLFQASGAADHAAEVLRGDARRTLAERLGLPPSAPAEVLAETAAARTGASAEEVLAVIGEDGVVDDERLVSLGQAVEDVRRAVLTVPEQRKE